MGVLLLLGACGNNESNANDAEADSADDFLNELNEHAEEESDNPTTDDPLEFVEEGKNGLHLVDGLNEYEVKNYYVSDETDKDGFNTYKDGDFELRYAIIETVNVYDGDPDGTEEIQIFGEGINDTDEDFVFDEHMYIKTDDNEESELSFNLEGAGSADQKSKFVDGFPLDYDTPDSFKLTLIDPSIPDVEEEFFDEGFELGEEYGEEFDEFEEEYIVIEEEFHKE